LSPATKVGISNSDSCLTAVTFATGVEANDVLSTMKLPVHITNGTQAVLAVKVIEFQTIEAVAQL